jgi:hypothetical protein
MPKHGRDERDSHNQQPRSGDRQGKRRGVRRRRIFESFLGTFSALMIVVLITAPVVGARRLRRRS